MILSLSNSPLYVRPQDKDKYIKYLLPALLHNKNIVQFYDNIKNNKLIFGEKELSNLPSEKIKVFFKKLIPFLLI